MDITVNQYSFVSPCRQIFSFPMATVLSMLDNPTSHKGLAKLYQTCKYFYGKRPILIADYVTFEMEEDDARNEVFGISFFLGNGVFKKVTHLKTPIWPTNKIEFHGYSRPNQRLPKLFRNTFQFFWMSHTDLKFEDFVHLTSENTVSTFIGHDIHSSIHHPDGSNATVDQILEHLPNIKEFTYLIDEKCSAEMLIKLNKMKFNTKFSDFFLGIEDVHPTFDFNLFCEFFKKNSNGRVEMTDQRNARTKEKLKLALQKLDPKWREEAHEDLKKWFYHLDPNWK